MYIAESPQNTRWIGKGRGDMIRHITAEYKLMVCNLGFPVCTVRDRWENPTLCKEAWDIRDEEDLYP